ncbi:MAG TPA: organic solvent tolerance protein [Bdellovibrionales bacterium]|nr:organic solvent tolerance protein [Bdellovibrionales bacterium]
MNATTRKNIAALLFVFAALVQIPHARAVDLTHRLGVGFANQFSTWDLPSIAVRYYTQSDLGFGANLGVRTRENDSAFGLGVKMVKVIFPEDKMNFYMGASAGLLSSKYQSTNDSGFELTAMVGGEFFWADLPSLGVSFEAGIGITSLSNGVSFRTIGDHPFKAGMVFYF